MGSQLNARASPLLKKSKEGALHGIVINIDLDNG